MSLPGNYQDDLSLESLQLDILQLQLTSALMKHFDVITLYFISDSKVPDLKEKKKTIPLKSVFFFFFSS